MNLITWTHKGTSHGINLDLLQSLKFVPYRHVKAGFDEDEQRATEARDYPASLTLYFAIPISSSESKTKFDTQLENEVYFGKEAEKLWVAIRGFNTKDLGEL